MTINSTIRSGLAVLLAFCLPGAQAARAEFAAGLAGRAVTLTGAREKFNEYRDLRTGLFVDSLDLDIGAGPSYLEVEAADGGLRTERYAVTGGRYGLYKVSVSYDRLPHNFAKGRNVLGGFGTGTQGVSSTVQAGLQTNEQTRGERGGVAGVDTTGEDAAQRAAIRDLISNAHEDSFGLERKKGAVALEFQPREGVRTWLKASDERRKGARVMGTGTYERYAQTTAAINGDGGHSSDQFVAAGQQVAEAVDYRTTTLNVGGGYYSRKASADLEYTLSEFKDELASLTWANPFRSADASATSAADALGTDAAGNSGYNRGRFAYGRLALPATNRSHEVAASASAELPLEGRISAAFGLGVVTNEADLLPYTANSAINAAIGAPANATSVAALPATKFSGKVKTLTQSFLVTFKPLERITTKAKYRVYDYDNQSPRISFPGYAAFGESHWRTRRNDSQALGAGAVNVPVSYLRQTAEVGADYAVLGPLTLGGEAFWDRWGYRNNRVNATDETGLGATAGLHLGHGLRAHGAYRWAHRASENYTVGASADNPEAMGLVNYNWADRVRNRAEAGLSLSPGAGLEFGVSGHLQNDDYGGEERFGLKEERLRGVSFDASYAASDAFEVSLNLGKDERRGTMWSAAKDNAFNNTATAIDDNWAANSFNPLNYWNSETIEKVDTLGLNAQWRPAERWEFDGGYAFSYGRSIVNTWNPNALDAKAAGYSAGAKLANGVAQTLPAVTSRLHELRLAAAYKMTKDVSFGLGYTFAKYMLNDFAAVGEYPQDVTTENTTRMVLAGADDFGYTAHQVTAKVAMRF